MISPELLRRYACFVGVDDEGLKRIAMISQQRSFEKGDVLFRQDEPANHLYVVTGGEVDVEYVTGSGDHASVDTLVAGDLLGWSAVVEPNHTRFAAIARKGTRVIAIDATNLRALIAEDHEMGYSLMTSVARVVSHRLEGAQVQLASRGA